jgi:hypothetical protein
VPSPWSTVLGSLVGPMDSEPGSSMQFWTFLLYVLRPLWGIIMSLADPVR